jgi:hypothetical protein
MKTILSLVSLCAAIASAQFSFALSAFDSGAGTSQSAALAHRGVLTGWVSHLMESTDCALLPGTLFPLETVVPVSDPPLLPILSIRLSGSDLRISWPATAADFVLQSADSLQSSWSTLSARCQTAGPEQFLVVRPSDSSRFYRLASR